MALGRTKSAAHSFVPETRPQLGLARPAAAGPVSVSPEAARLEAETLRILNARLRREVAALKEREAQAQRLADRDALTGLFNRRRLAELLQAAIDDAGESGQRVGLLFIDLNGFKAINDVHGHAAGDKILTMVASRLNTRVRVGDIVCRYGGDEFVVVLPSIADAAAMSHVADTIRERVALPYQVDGREQHLSAAIGESMYPRDAANAELLLKHADQAMYRRKVRLARPADSLFQVLARAPARRRGDASRPK
jgi:diguanylate cyclase (GGDEF)-like protein